MKATLLALFFVLSALVSFAAPPERDTQHPASVDATTKPAWAWTDEERIAARVDPAQIATRLQAFRADPRAHRAVPSDDSASRPYDYIDGRSHPELFLRAELFRYLVFSAYSTSGEFRDTTRELLTRDAVAVGLPAEFLETLQPHVAEAAATFQEERELIRSGEPPSQARVDALVAIRARRCRGIAAGLEAAYRLFGKEKFDRFLYTAIAPNHFQEWFEVPTHEKLQRNAGGCE